MYNKNKKSLMKDPLFKKNKILSRYWLAVIVCFVGDDSKQTITQSLPS